MRCCPSLPRALRLADHRQRHGQYKSIAWELGLPAERSRAAAYRSIRAEVTRQVREANRMPVLIIDDVQFLRTDGCWSPH